MTEDKTIGKYVKIKSLTHTGGIPLSTIRATGKIVGTSGMIDIVEVLMDDPKMRPDRTGMTWLIHKSDLALIEQPIIPVVENNSIDLSELSLGYKEEDN